MKIQITALLLLGVLIFMRQTGPRNVRNNNPLNIRENPNNNWVGASGDDGEFVIFESPEYGFRAAYKLLMNYASLHGRNTIASIIERWAPPNENDTDRYIMFVADRLQLSPAETLSASDYPALIYAMAEKEGAKGAFSMTQIYDGIALA